MLFNSHEFLFVFLPLVWVLFHGTRHLRLPWLPVPLLAISSIAFYAWWNPPYVIVLLVSIGFNFGFTRLVMKSRRHLRWPLILGLAVNLAALGYFKYTNFLLSNVGVLLDQSWQIPQILLPLGISFFTFQQISYLVDFHNGVTDEHSFWHYVLFVGFFPQLIAGPIVHHAEIIPQFQKNATRGLSSENLAVGMFIFSIGLFKKVVLADSLSPWSRALFDGSAAPGLAEAWTGTLCYTLQIYFDFSGYSDMAIGLGRLFNVNIPINFNAPYQAGNIAEFWRRWHMTLSRFLKDYLYIPLGGSRNGRARRYINLMLTMLLGGLWHGANWTFVLWGAVHGALLCLHQGANLLLEKLRIRVPFLFSWFVTFVAVALAWVLFRSPSVDRAVAVYRGLFGMNDGKLSLPTAEATLPFDISAILPFAVNEQLVVLTVCLAVALFLPPSWKVAESRSGILVWPAALVGGVLFAVSVLMMTRVTEFLYFQF